MPSAGKPAMGNATLVGGSTTGSGAFQSVNVLPTASIADAIRLARADADREVQRQRVTRVAGRDKAGQRARGAEAVQAQVEAQGGIVVLLADDDLVHAGLGQRAEVELNPWYAAGESGQHAVVRAAYLRAHDSGGGARSVTITRTMSPGLALNTNALRNR